MKDLDLAPEALDDLASAIDASLAADRPAAWQTAFGAADAKSKEPLAEQLAPQIADAGEGATPDPGSTSEAEAAARTVSFLALVKGWLGRA
jgi:hypothetical protein